jgi:hypothetical protein
MSRWKPPISWGARGAVAGTRCDYSAPAQYDALPGMAFPAPADTYPGKEAVADFLRDYASRFSLPVQLSKRVTELSRIGEEFQVRTDDEVFRAQQVLVATGPFQSPFRPETGHGFDGSVTQIHSADYRNPQSLPPGSGPGCRCWELRTADRSRARRDPAGRRVGGGESADVAAGGRELDSADDRAAVLDWRLDDPGHHNACQSPLPWLPGIPQGLREHPVWGTYLAARSDLVRTLADQVGAIITDTDPPAWATQYGTVLPSSVIEEVSV